MSLENEDQLSLQFPVGGSTHVSDQKKPRIKYTKDFVLSLSELDVCKKLPSGLDRSILSDLEATNTAFEKQRSAGNLSLQGSRRGEYGSQLLNRSENSNNYTKLGAGRWDTRSSGSSDKEGDLHSDRESFTQDPGRRLGNQNRRTWQPPEHDGLLGSGALARPPGFAGASATKVRGNGPYQLNRSTEPYQPPRAYKAQPYSRKDGTDLCNDETFGSSECSNEDRVKEERKRRESFELMRKEQQKALQERNGKDIRKGNFGVDIMALLENSDADKTTNNLTKLDESSADSVSPRDSSKSSLIHGTAARPLVPPGFASTVMEKSNQSNKPKSTALHSTESSSTVAAVGFGNLSSNTTTGSQEEEVREVLEEGQKETVPDRLDAASSSASVSIFDKLFESALLTNNSIVLASDVQNCYASDEADEKAWTSNQPSESSKFAHLFHEEFEDNSRSMQEKSSRDLLSLLVYNEGAAPHKARVTSNAVLTCEDLEQSILAEAEGVDGHSVVQPAVAPPSEAQTYVVDNHASHHLLSLLQRGAEAEQSPGKHLTLETLFGAAFMNELHSMEAPVSKKDFHLPEKDSLIPPNDSLSAVLGVGGEFYGEPRPTVPIPDDDFRFCSHQFDAFSHHRQHQQQQQQQQHLLPMMDQVPIFLHGVLPPQQLRPPDFGVGDGRQAQEAFERQQQQQQQQQQMMELEMRGAANGKQFHHPYHFPGGMYTPTELDMNLRYR